MARKVGAATGDLFEAVGGAAKCLELSRVFYARAVRDPLLRPLFPGKSQRCAIEAFTAFLVQFLGGPPGESQHRWWLSLRESHARFRIEGKEREAWMAQMRASLGDVALNEGMRDALRSLFEEASAYLVNAGPAVGGAEICGHMRGRWEEQRALDEAVAALRLGDLARTAELVEGAALRSRFGRDRAVMAHFAGLLMGSGMAEYGREILAENPDLARERYAGRTLLHAAAAAGDLPMVAALLELGVDADVKDAGGHTPLYCVGNECAGGGAVVRALIAGGARVDACGGVKRCTALHMAARRGNVEAAEALLECGASLEARDSLGVTPLRRAVNCRQRGMADFLLAKGAISFDGERR